MHPNDSRPADPRREAPADPGPDGARGLATVRDRTRGYFSPEPMGTQLRQQFEALLQQDGNDLPRPGRR